MCNDNTNFKDLIKTYDDLYTLSIVIIYNNCRCAVDCNKLDGQIMLNRLIVHNKLRKRGIASLLMKELCEYLDKNKLDCILGVESDGTSEMDDNLLVEFYKRYGFESTEEDKYYMLRKSR